MKALSKILFPLFCLLVLLGGTLFNLLFLTRSGGILGTVGLLGVGLCGTILSTLILRWEGSRAVRAGLVALPALVTLLSAAAMAYYYGATNQQPVCSQNPLLLSIVPMSIAYILVGGEAYARFLVRVSRKRA